MGKRRKSSCNDEKLPKKKAKTVCDGDDSKSRELVKLPKKAKTVCDGDDSKCRELVKLPKRAKSVCDGDDWNSREVVVWDDYENCPIPRKVEPEDFYELFVKKLKQQGFSGPIDFTMVGGYSDSIPNNIYKVLKAQGQIKIEIAINYPRPLPTESETTAGNQAGDKHIKLLIKEWLKVGVKINRKPCNTMLLSGDNGFKNNIKMLSEAGHNTLVSFHKKKSDPNTSLQVQKWAKRVWDWKELLSVEEDCVAGKTMKGRTLETILAQRRKNKEKLKKLKKEKKRKEKRKQGSEVEKDEKKNAQDEKEKKREIKNRLKLLSRREVQITRDGNCLFRAISHQLQGNEKNHMKIRQDVVSYILQNREEYREFYIRNVDEGYKFETLEEFCEDMSRNGVWGDHLTLRAAANVYNARINVVYVDDTPMQTIMPTVGDGPHNVLWVLYDGSQGNTYFGSHYNSLV